MAGFVLVQDVPGALRCEWLVLPCATRSPTGSLPLDLINQKRVLLWKYWLPLDLTSQEWAFLLGVEDGSRLRRLTVLQGLELPWYLSGSHLSLVIVLSGYPGVKARAFNSNI